jgi:hypothetical protein
VTILPPSPPKAGKTPAKKPPASSQPSRDDERERVLREVLDNARAEAEARAAQEAEVYRAIRDALARGDNQRARARVEQAIAEHARQANERSQRHRALLERYLESQRASPK